MNIRPPITVGGAGAKTASGTPKAHFSFRRGTSSCASCAISAGWKRLCEGSTPQPFQWGAFVGSVKGTAALGHALLTATAVPSSATATPNFDANETQASTNNALGTITNKRIFMIYPHAFVLLHLTITPGVKRLH